MTMTTELGSVHRLVKSFLAVT